MSGQEQPGQEQPDVEGGGIHAEATGDPMGRDAGNEDSPDEGPSMSGTGAGPSGNAMDHWATAMPNTDATKPETMPNTETEPLPGETRDSNPA